MKLCHYHPEELLTNKHQQMFHSLWVSGTIAVVGAAASIASTSIAASENKKAADKAADKQKKAGKSFAKRLEAATKIYNENITAISASVAEIDPNIQVPSYSLLGNPEVYKKDKDGNVKLDKNGDPIIKDKKRASAVLEGIEAANKLTEASLYQLNNVLPGATAAREKAMRDITMWENKLENQYQQIQQAYPVLAGASKQYEQAGKLLQEQLPQIKEARAVAGEYLTGDLPDITKRQITKAIAETGGAGYNPASAGRISGFQMPQGMLSQNLAQAAEERQRFGLNAVAQITGQANQFSANQANIAQGQTAVAQGYGQAGAAAANIGEAARGMQATNMAWQTLSQGFLQNAPQIMQLGMSERGQDIDQQRLNIVANLEKQKTLGNLETGRFEAASGTALDIYKKDQEAIATNLAASQANANMWGSIGGAVGSGLTSIGTAGLNYAGTKGGNLTSGSYASSIQPGATSMQDLNLSGI